MSLFSCLHILYLFFVFFCILLDCDHSPSTTPSGPEGCVDKLENCADFGKDACSGIFHTWALDNCPRYCNLCKSLSNFINKIIIFW